MEPVKLGRTLGIGMRVASGMLRDRAGRIGQKQATAAKPGVPAKPPVLRSEIARTEPAQAAPGSGQPLALAPLAESSVDPGSAGRRVAVPIAKASSLPAALGRRAGERVRASRRAPGKARMAARGLKGFAAAFWGPIRHASGVLWLEITGMFFALFGLFFAQNVYEARSAWIGGAEHEHFLLYVALTLIFIWFSASSFLRAHRRSRKQQGR